MTKSTSLFSRKEQVRFFSLVALVGAFLVGLLQGVNQSETSTEIEAIDDHNSEIVKVIRVIDGDTIELENGQTVRYIGIDTPETKHPSKGKECFGQEASARNQQLVEGKIVQLEKDVSETDRYGRLLRYVWVDQQLVNQILVEEGYAHAASFPPDIKRQDQLIEAEKIARQLNRGLWGYCNVAQFDQGK